LAKDGGRYKLLKSGIFSNWRDHEGDHVPIEDNKTGNFFYGQIRIKEVRCGKKNCDRCPHARYAYARFRDGKHVREKYLGVAR